MIDHPSNGLFVNPTPQTREDCLPSEDPERANSDSSLTSITCKGDAHYSAISARVGRKTKPKQFVVLQKIAVPCHSSEAMTQCSCGAVANTHSPREQLVTSGYTL